jgi:riboflavin kinase/FMN adenylyltransferase
MELVDGVAGLRPAHGPLFAVVGVFDGLHRGHTYLLDVLVREAAVRSARPGVITFDHHPDEVLTGSAPPLLLDPAERIELLAACGVEIVVVQHFDEAVRRTSYDAFVEAIRAHTALAGLLMTPDAAFGFERRGTPEALAALGARLDFDVVVIPTFAIDGQAVRSSDIRAAVASGDLDRATRLLGRPLTLRGRRSGDRLLMDFPMALPPDGIYEVSSDGRRARLRISGSDLTIDGNVPAGPVNLTFVEAAGDAAAS